DDAVHGRVDADRAAAGREGGRERAGGGLLCRPRCAGESEAAVGRRGLAQAVRAGGAAGRGGTSPEEAGGLMARKVRTLRRKTLGLISRKKSLYSTRRLLEAAKARGFRARLIDVLRCDLALEPGHPRLYHRGKEVRGLSVAIPRIGASVTQAGLS